MIYHFQLLIISDNSIVKEDFIIPHDPIFYSIKSKIKKEKEACHPFIELLIKNTRENIRENQMIMGGYVQD